MQKKFNQFASTDKPNSLINNNVLAILEYKNGNLLGRHIHHSLNQKEIFLVFPTRSVMSMEETFSFTEINRPDWDKKEVP